MDIVIVKYNAGNVTSVDFALRRLGITSIVSSDPEVIAAADKVIFPGVGEASSAMQHLKEEKLDLLILSLKQPVLGVCLGMQLMCRHSEEGDTNCLNIFPVEVRKFVRENNSPELKIPHMGWNTISKMSGKLFKGVPENDYVYYVHSYYAEICESTCATTNYIQPFTAALQKDNFYGTQFHPEKSGIAGEFVLRNFFDL
jgi:glutamine amidotransferase